MNTRAMIRSGTRALIGAKSVNSIIRQKRSLNNYNKQVKRSRTQKSTSSYGLGLTNQRDTARLYRSRRRSRRSRRWGRFQKRVLKAVDKQIPSQIELMRQHLDLTSTTNTQQSFACSLYGEQGIGAQRDIGDSDLFNLINQSAVAPTNSTKINLKGAFLDMYITNTGDPLALVSTTVYIDIYTVYCRKDTYQYSGVEGFFNGTFQDSVNLPGAGAPSVLTNSVYGVTPFMNPMFCSHFKIGEAKRVVLAPGETYNTQMRDRKNRTYYFGKTEKVVCKKGWTKGFLCIFKGAAGFNSQDVASNVAVEALRTYDYVPVTPIPQRAGFVTI